MSGHAYQVTVFYWTFCFFCRSHSKTNYTITSITKKNKKGGIIYKRSNFFMLNFFVFLNFSTFSYLFYVFLPKVPHFLTWFSLYSYLAISSFSYLMPRFLTFFSLFLLLFLVFLTGFACFLTFSLYFLTFFPCILAFFSFFLHHQCYYLQYSTSFIWYSFFNLYICWIHHLFWYREQNYLPQ